MSLERVIADQQAKIDEQAKRIADLEERSAKDDLATMKRQERRDRLYRHIQRLIENRDEARAGDLRHEVHMHMLEDGWCRECETCFCFGDCQER